MVDPLAKVAHRCAPPDPGTAREVDDPPIYQRLAREAARLRELALGLSDHEIGLRFRVTDKTATKAIRWFLGRSDGAS